MVVVAYNADNARLSETVSLSLESRYFLSAAAILYGLPLIALLAGAALGYYGAIPMHLEHYGPVIGLVLGVCFTIAAYLVIKVFDKRIKKSFYIPIAHVS